MDGGGSISWSLTGTGGARDSFAGATYLPDIEGLEPGKSGLIS